MTLAAAALDQAMTIERRMDGAARGNADLTGRTAQQAFADFARATTLAERHSRFAMLIKVSSRDTEGSWPR